MQYLLLIYEDESLMAARSDAENGVIMGEWFAYTQALRDAGVYRGGDALHPVAAATTVRVRGGKTTTTDGPFAETKEQLGGYYLIEAPDLDAALMWAARCPAAKTGSMEVRPVMVFDV